MRESTKRETLEMYKKYREGISIPKLAVLHGYTYKTIYKRFEELGLETFPRGYFNVVVRREDMPQIIRLRKMGKSYAEIGRICHASADAVLCAFERYNIPKEGRMKRT